MRWASAAAVGLLAACATTPSLTSFPAVPVPELSCQSDTDDVTWVRTAPPEHRPTLDAWCTSVGPAWRHSVTPPATPVDTLVVVSWNLNVGRGNLDDLISYIQTELKDELTDERLALVLLLQEVHRTGDAVPPAPRFPGTAPRAIAPSAGAPDIVQLAQAHGLSAVYVPSMRNGTGQDRGNAVLTTETLIEPRAIELPFGTQRRVAVGATIVLPSGHESDGIQVISTHLDTGRERVRQAEALAAVVSPPHPTIVSGDFNSVEGQNDGTFKALAGRLSAESCGDRRTHAWPWRLELFFGGWVGRLDHIFTNLADDHWSTRCSTIPHFFGSDHRPILLVLVNKAREPELHRPSRALLAGWCTAGLLGLSFGSPVFVTQGSAGRRRRHQERPMTRSALRALTLALVMLGAVSLAAQQGRPLSPPGTATAMLGGEWTKNTQGNPVYQGGKWIEVSYSRPMLRQRADIFGSGADYGKAVTAGAPVWRVGADQTTTFKTEVPLVFGGTRLPAGEYSMFVDLKGPAEWTLVLSSWPRQEKYDPENKTALWGAYNYTADKDVMRVPMQVDPDLSLRLDQLTIFFCDVTKNGGKLAIAWDTTVAMAEFTAGT